ncbi:hypothetical protein ACQP2Y_12530 [Actinoplanes sp. CA-051413]|uniref:hypothetical protein n=1 Tax=Actinoplanes sp. CA-051413 TaxID=3239899 RepID=UPI003D95E9B5
MFWLDTGTVDLGDLVVSRASATSGAHSQKVAECRLTAAAMKVRADTLLQTVGMRLDSNTDIPVWLGLTGSGFHIHEASLPEHSAEILGAVA